jgi:hypothetical protein
VFYLPLAVLTWCSAAWMLDRRRLPRLLVFAVVGGLLATVQDHMMLVYPLWEYRDTGPMNTHLEISFLISLSAAPVYAMRFAQGLQPGAAPPWRRICRYTAISMLPEWVATHSGHIAYHNWWNVAWSVLAYLPIWLVIWAVHRWMTAAQVRTARVKRQTAPGT